MRRGSSPLPSFDVSHVNFGTVRAPAGTLSSNGDAYDLSASANIVKVGLNFAF